MNIALSTLLCALEPHLAALELRTTSIGPRYTNYLHNEAMLPVIDSNEKVLGNILLQAGADDPEVTRFSASEMKVALGGKVYNPRYKDLNLLLRDFGKLEEIIATVPTAKNQHLVPALKLYNVDENWSLISEAVIYDLADCLLIESIADGDDAFSKNFVKNRVPMSEMDAYAGQNTTQIRALYGWGK